MVLNTTFQLHYSRIGKPLCCCLTLLALIAACPINGLAAPPDSHSSGHLHPADPRVAAQSSLNYEEQAPAYQLASSANAESESGATYFSICDSCPRCGVHCIGGNCGSELGWDVSGIIPWEVFAQGEYIGPHRSAHVPEYRLRADDLLEFVYRITAEKSTLPYRLQAGDSIRIESLSAEEYTRETLVQPDGSITLPLVGEVMAAGLTFNQLRASLEAEFGKHVNEAKISLTPLVIDTRLQELRSAVDSRAGTQGGQSRQATVTPEGTIQLPAIGSVQANGLTMDELKREIDQRYSLMVHGMEVTPILIRRAPRFVFVLGEVFAPGRYDLQGPTTLMQAIALAGGWTGAGANLNEIVVFRRDENWCLMATRLDIRGALFAKRPCPADEIWLRDSDIVVLPKRKALVADEWINLIFTRGIYGIVPFGVGIQLADTL